MKKLLSLALAMIMVLATLSAVFTINGFATDDEEDEGVITPDTSWYNESATEYEIADAADFLGFAVLLNGTKNEAGDAYDVEPVTFKGKTVKLTANIDVNPGWNANEYFTNLTDEGEGSDMTFAIDPANKWPINNNGPIFQGTLDGQNHYVSGIFAPFNQAHDVALFGSAGAETDVTVTIKNGAFLKSYVGLGGCRVGGFIANGAGPVVFENVYNAMCIYAWRTDQKDIAGGFMGYASYSGTGDITVKDCVFAGSILAATDGMCISAFVGGINAANQELKYEDCLNIGTLKGGTAQGSFTIKNKGITKLDTCVVNGTFDKDVGYLVARDLRGGEGVSYEGKSVLYVATECKGVFNKNASYAGAEPTATEVTVENLKNIGSWAVAQSIAGFSDWTATLEDGGIKMPITADLAAAVKAFSAPAVTPDENPGGDNNEENQTPADDNDKKDDTTEAPDTEAPESTKAAETTEAAEEKGCGGIIGAGAIAIVAVTGAALAIGAKKKED